LHGSSGKMGVEIQKALAAAPTAAGAFRLAGGSDRTFTGEQLYQGRPVTKELLAHALTKDGVAAVADFSTEEGNQLLLEAFRAGPVKGKAVLIGTTGLAAARLDAWRQLARDNDLRLLIAPNTSVGVLVAVKAALLAAAPLTRLGFDIEITETHHREKRDAPSGTARFIAETLAAGTGTRVAADRCGKREQGELGVHAVRGGGVCGEHEVRFLGDAEEIRITHRAFTRALFAGGALTLVRWLLEQPVGAYGLLDVGIDGLA
jgi:4-hydroxy-tetrahydrodipicolinate reductase